MAEISIKSFYARSDGSVEIRRFALPKEEAKNFNLLREKLLSVYNGSATNDILTRDDIIMAWKDDEGDEVSISSDDELNFALKAQNGDVFKINIRKIKKCNTSSSSKCHHPGVVCDNCNKEIYGFRYKCMECPNFDLCGTCENAGNHSEHSMMRLVTPGSRIPHHWFRNGRPHRAHHKWNKFNENGGGGGGGGDGPATGPKRPCDSRRARFTGEPFHPYNLINRVWSALGVQIPPQKGAEKEPEGGESSASGTNGSGGEQNESKLAPDEYLRSVGEAVASFLDPFGIDVLVDVETGGVRTTVSRKDKQNEDVEDVEMNDENKPNEPKNNCADAETGVVETDSVGQCENTENREKNSIDEGEWTCLDNEVEDPMRNLPELLSEFHVRDSEASHPDPLIAGSIDQMTSMGFNNDGGWLTSILVLCGGDVTRVIDLLGELGESNGPTRPFIQAFVALLEKYEGDTAKVVAIMRSMNEK